MTTPPVPPTRWDAAGPYYQDPECPENVWLGFRNEGGQAIAITISPEYAALIVSALNAQAVSR